MRVDTTTFPKGHLNFTFSAWIKILQRDPAGHAVVFANNIKNGFQFGFSTHGKNLFPHLFVGEKDVFDSHSNPARVAFRLDLTRWRHMLITRKRKRVIFYLDNNKIAAGTASKPISGSQLILGGREGPDHLWKGNLDEVRIYNRALSDVEIEQLYEFERAAR